MVNKSICRIFEGKRADYNIAILEALLENGPLTNWEIAKKIYQNRGTTKNREIGYARSQRIYSVIVRKGGRIDSLNNAGYILQKEDRKWELCFPKGLVILIKKQEILSKINEYYLQKRQLPQRFTKSKRTIVAPFGLRFQVDEKILQAEAQRLLNNLNTQNMIWNMAKSMEKLIQEGIDIDKIDNTKLLPLVIQGMQGFITDLKDNIRSDYEKLK